MTAAALNLRRVAMRKVHLARTAQRNAATTEDARLLWNSEIMQRERAGEGTAFINRDTGWYFLIQHPKSPPTRRFWSWGPFLP